MINNKVKYVLMIILLICSGMIFCSCDSKKADQSDPVSSADTEEPSRDVYDFSGLASQKYAEIFSRTDPETVYTLKWHYSTEDKDLINYICCDGKKGSWALKLTPPLFSENNFIVKDKKLIDLYENDKKYFETDMIEEAQSMGFFSYDEFESYVCDIFAGMYYLSSSEEDIDGRKMNCDTYFTNKQVKIKLCIDTDGELYAMQPVMDESDEKIYMYIDEFSENSDDSVFNIPSDYKKEVQEDE